MKKIIYNDRELILTPYLTSTERDILVLNSTDIDDILIILEPYIQLKINDTLLNINDIIKLSESEKIYIIFELRNISVSEVFSFIKKCDNCNNKFDFDINLENVLIEGNIKDYKNIKLKNIISDDINDFSDMDLEELDINLYDELIYYIENNKTRFDFSSIVTCPYCETKKEINIKKDVILENLSEDTVLNFYKTISSMIYFGKYSKLDIDSMIPFERSIYLGLLNEQIKKDKE